jgi:putative CRISPR-associated protein (TIGR02619 family)
MPTVYVGVVVGVSMLRNAVDRGVAGDVVRRALEGEARALEELGRLSLGGSLTRALLNFACSDPEGCCAELSSIAGLRGVVEGDFRVELYYTDTRTSWLCSLTIAQCLSSGILPNIEVVGSVQIPLFSGDPEGGLASLVNAVGKRLFEAAAKGWEAYLVITGGTKVEAVLASMVAWLLGARPVYRVEGGPLLILPKLPIALADELVNSLCNLAKGNPVPSGTVAELARLGFVVKSGGGYTVPRWVVELLRVRGLC